MTIVAVGNDKTGAQCDHEGCTEIAPDPGRYMIEHSLTRWPGWVSLGWHCSGGKHLCPAHAPKDR